MKAVYAAKGIIHFSMTAW